jgi:hypothetical protein
MRERIPTAVAEPLEQGGEGTPGRAALAAAGIEEVTIR